MGEPGAELGRAEATSREAMSRVVIAKKRMPCVRSQMRLLAAAAVVLYEVSISRASEVAGS